MAKIEDFIAFKAAIEIHKDNGTYDSVIEKTYIKCKTANESGIYKKNHVKDIYKDFSPEQISFKMCEMLVDENSNVELDIIFQKLRIYIRHAKITKVIGILLAINQHQEEIKL